MDDKKVSDHHAIIPTEEAAIFSNMTNEERRIYDLVVRRFLSVLYPPFEYEQTSLKADLGGELFATEGQAVLSKGWKTVYEDGDATEKEAKALPALKKGSVLTPDQITLISGKSTPPPRFTEATLLSAMENPLHYMESRDSRERKALTETGGLGTVATRADIIEKLFHSFLIEKKWTGDSSDFQRKAAPFSGSGGPEKTQSLPPGGKWSFPISPREKARKSPSSGILNPTRRN